MNTMTKTSKLNKASKTNTFLGLNLVPRLIPTLILGSTLSFVLSFLFSLTLSPTSYAAPSTFTVTNTNDSGAGSLRQAIEDANSNGNPGDQDVIEFDIGGAGTKTITASSGFVISQSVLVDGYTQSDASPNTSSFPDPLNGVIRIEIYFNTGNGFDITGSNVTLRSLAAYQPSSISDPFDPIVKVDSADDFELLGSYIGVDFTGLNSYTMYGIMRDGMIEVRDSSDVRLGSENAGDRNIFGMCGGSCVYSINSTGLRVQGSNIGVGADGLSPFYGDSGFDKSGIFLDSGSDDAQIGSQTSGGGNYFYYLTQGALRAQDLSNLSVYGNLFYRNSGVRPDLDGNPNYQIGVIGIMGVSGANIGSVGNGKNRMAGNFGDVIWLLDSPTTSNATENVHIIGNTMGYNYNESSPLENYSRMIVTNGNTHDVLIQNNTLHNNTCPVYCGGGFAAVIMRDNSQDISVISNSIFNGNSNIGIDSGDNGTSPNDSNDSDTGPNDMLNSPGYTQIVEDGGNTEVDFTIDVPAGDYRIEFFSNTSALLQGENYLGYTNISSSGMGLEAFSHTLSGTGHTNMTLTATRIDPDLPNGFGPSSEFGSTGDIVVPPESHSDLSTSKRLLNPEDKSVGNVLNYEIKITNNGPSDLNLDEMNNYSTPGGGSLFVDFLPPQLAYSGISGTNIACTDFGAGSAVMFGPLLANHLDHSIVVCGHTGNDVLPSGQTVTYTFSATVVDLMTPDFFNHVFAQFSSSTNPAMDPDGPTMANILNSGNDIIDGMRNSGINNYSTAYSDVADLSLTGSLLNPNEIATGGTLHYSLEFKNNGPSAINPQQFDGSGMNPLITSLLVALLPPNAAFLSQNNPDLTCIWGGPGSATMAPYFGTHSDYSILICMYIGSNTSLAAGQTIPSILDISYTGPDQDLSAYFLMNLTDSDKDKFGVGSAFMNGINNNTADAIDYLDISNINNFLRVSYIKPGVSVSDGSSTSGGLSSLLSKTGQGVIILSVAVLFIIATVYFLYSYKRQPKIK